MRSLDRGERDERRVRVRMRAAVAHAGDPVLRGGRGDRQRRRHVLVERRGHDRRRRGRRRDVGAACGEKARRRGPLLLGGSLDLPGGGHPVELVLVPGAREYPRHRPTLALAGAGAGVLLEQPHRGGALRRLDPRRDQAINESERAHRAHARGTRLGRPALDVTVGDVHRPIGATGVERRTGQGRRERAGFVDGGHGSWISGMPTRGTRARSRASRSTARSCSRRTRRSPTSRAIPRRTSSSSPFAARS